MRGVPLVFDSLAKGKTEVRRWRRLEGAGTSE